MVKQLEQQSCCGEVTTEEHPDHSAEINRINRIKGQLDGIRRMIEERKYCPDIITQTSAVRSAIASLETAILEKHLASCVHAAMSEGGHDAKAKVSELVEIFKRAIR
ncbi:MAG: metal-sensitive transcriptional regulator [Deltaproteobacteria bacterium]|nr:metal-sensitive transcriptional regulator [Deltaproteobacteria bacterium]